jgi:ParB/RepB/Spo0J family partition protein
MRTKKPKPLPELQREQKAAGANGHGTPPHLVGERTGALANAHGSDPATDWPAGDAAPDILPKRGKRKRSTGASSLPGPAAAAPDTAGAQNGIREEAPVLSPHSDGDEIDAEECAIDFKQIRPSPYQVRRDFPAAELQGLADSLKAHGLRQAIVVRPVGDPARKQFELLCGERRLRAAKLAGWTSIRCSIQQASDAQAREIVLLENLQRQDLNAIEEAYGYQAILSGPAASTQSDLATRLGKTQGQISNRLRLLTLPAAIQAHVISGEIPPSWARALVPLCENPKAAAIVAKAVAEECRPRKWAARKGAGGEWRLTAEKTEEGFCDDVRMKLRQAAGPIDDDRWDQKTGLQLGGFTPTAEQLAMLDMIEIPGWDDKPERYALDLKAWRPLAIAAAKAREAGKKKPAKTEKAAANGGAKPFKALTPAEQKAAAEAEKRRREERRRQFARRREQIRADWYRWLIADKVLCQVDEEQLLELTTLAALKGWANGYSARHVEKAVVKIKDRPINERARRLVAEICWNSAEKCPSTIADNGEIEDLAGFVGIDPAAAWAAAQLGPLSEAYWGAHDKEELAKLTGATGNYTKGDLVAELIADNKRPLPKELELKARKAKKGR